MCDVIALFSIPVMRVVLFMGKYSHIEEFLMNENGWKNNMLLQQKSIQMNNNLA